MKSEALLIIRAQLNGADFASCVFFQGSGRAKGGYGRIVIKGPNGAQSYAAHRLALEVSGTEIKAGQIVRHTCHSPQCINPRHLQTGTHKENAKDRVEAGRCATQKGASNGNAKTTASQRAEIRARRKGGETLKTIAQDYGIHFSTVSAIVKSVN